MDKKPPKKLRTVGRPKQISDPVPVTEINAGEENQIQSLLLDLNRSGKLTKITKDVIREAHDLYINNIHATATLVARQLNLETIIVQRWVTIYGWEEERDLIQYKLHKDLYNLQSKLSPNIELRHDRIAATIEQLIEGMLKEPELSAGAIRVLANTLKTTVDIRRTLRGSDDKAVKHEVIHHFPTQMQELAVMVDGLVNERPAEVVETKQVEVSIGKSMDFDEDDDE